MDTTKVVCEFDGFLAFIIRVEWSKREKNGIFPFHSERECIYDNRHSFQFELNVWWQFASHSSRDLLVCTACISEFSIHSIRWIRCENGKNHTHAHLFQKRIRKKDIPKERHGKDYIKTNCATPKLSTTIITSN